MSASLGLVLPHGPVRAAADVAAVAIAMAPPEEVAIVLAPNHARRGPRGAILSEGTLGGSSVPIDATIAESVRALAGLTESPEAFAGERSILSILPWLVAARPRLALVPVLLHDLPPASAARIGGAIASAIAGRGGGVTLVATTDLGAYADPTTLRAVGEPILARAAALDPDGVLAAEAALPSTIEVCGMLPLLVAVHALRALDAPRGAIAAIGASDDPHGKCVGYGSIVFAPS